MSALRRLPALATTGVGSLPFTGPAEAVRHAANAYDVPFCPQLPRCDGDMIREWLGADPARCGWSPDRDRQRPAAWDAFLAEVTARPPAHRIVKLQVTGPVTLACALERGGGRPGGGRETLALAGEIARWLAVSVREQLIGLRERGLDALLLVDEPGLAGLGLTDVTVWDPLRLASAAGWGLHVCGAVPWTVVDAAEPDVLSYDLTRDHLPPHARLVLSRLLARGGRVAWGAVDPVAPESVAGTAARLAAALAGLGRRATDAATASLVTPACGTGRLSPARERLVAATLDAAVRVTAGAVGAYDAAAATSS
ncbi:MAG TPA: hypothetical protein VFX51_03600 [Solirubrobacteraceae bacterium]|nr:hypothetical protein [Solirubrobacteraceae bacterium]